MLNRLTGAIRRAPLAWFYALSVLIVVLTIPLFLLTGAQEAIDQAFTLTGAPFNTDLLTWARLVYAYPQAALGALLALIQVAAPDIAVLLIGPIAFGWPGLRTLERRFRFWSADVPWQRGVALWLGAVGLMAALSLTTAALSRWLLPVVGFSWTLGLRPLPLLFGLLTAMFLDGGGLFEENGWRGFALPLLLQRHTPIVATVILGVLWALWHLPVKFDLFLTYGVAAATLLFVVLTVKFIAISLIITYFWQRLGQTTIIAIAIHGLSNDSLRLGGAVLSETFAAQFGYEVNLMLPLLGAALVLWRGRRG